MKSKKGYKKSLGLLLSNKTIVICLISAMMLPSVCLSEPVEGGIALPPASFTFIDDIETLRNIGLDGFDGAWCYDNDANAILITAASRERAQCELRNKYEIEKVKAKHDFEVSKLNIRIETLLEQHESILSIKDREIEKLTEAALKRPTDYSAWWASGGVVVGVITTVLITMAVSN